MTAPYQNAKLKKSFKKHSKEGLFQYNIPGKYQLALKATSLWLEKLKVCETC